MNAIAISVQDSFAFVENSKVRSFNREPETNTKSIPNTYFGHL